MCWFRRVVQRRCSPFFCFQLVHGRYPHGVVCYIRGIRDVHLEGDTAGCVRRLLSVAIWSVLCQSESLEFYVGLVCLSHVLYGTE